MSLPNCKIMPVMYAQPACSTPDYRSHTGNHRGEHSLWYPVKQNHRFIKLGKDLQRVHLYRSTQQHTESFAENLRWISLPKGSQLTSIKKVNQICTSWFLFLGTPLSYLWCRCKRMIKLQEPELHFNTMKHHVTKLYCSRSIRCREVQFSPGIVSCGWL